MGVLCCLKRKRIIKDSGSSAMLPFYEVDVFAARPFMGNPLAVVMHADGLDAAHMQRIARWLNLSETVFIRNADEALPELRIFAPNRELPFAGHPLIGAGRVLVSTSMVNPADGQFRVRCQRGPIWLNVQEDQVQAMVSPPGRRATNFDASEVKRALGLGPEFDAEPGIYDAGATWMVVRVDSTDTLETLRPAMGAIESISDQLGLTGITVYAVSDNASVHTRSFAPATGIPEDPVCGSGNLCVAGHARDTGVAEQLGGSWTAYQGQSMERDGRIQIDLEDDYVTFGGPSVIRLEGKITPGSR
jgi:PhzF family phenazine biosynthesis protein